MTAVSDALRRQLSKRSCRDDRDPSEAQTGPLSGVSVCCHTSVLVSPSNERIAAMSRFFALFAIPARVIDEWVKSTPEDKRQAMSQELMGAWQKWMAENGKYIVDRGAPLGKTKRVTAKGVGDIRNDLNWYLILEAESHEVAARIFTTHPHLQIPEASVEIMAIPNPAMM